VAEIKPNIEGGVPWCDESCPQHDGKRCKHLGFPPETLCIPAVKQMRTDLRKYKRLIRGG